MDLNSLEVPCIVRYQHWLHCPSCCPRADRVLYELRSPGGTVFCSLSLPNSSLASWIQLKIGPISLRLIQEGDNVPLKSHSGNAACKACGSEPLCCESKPAP